MPWYRRRTCGVAKAEAELIENLLGFGEGERTGDISRRAVCGSVTIIRLDSDGN
jgi:hypothetical protein